MSLITAIGLAAGGGVLAGTVAWFWRWSRTAFSAVLLALGVIAVAVTLAVPPHG